MVFLSHGFRRWAEYSNQTGRESELWNWLTDQILVAQGRYAFSIGCICFQGIGEQSEKILLIKREFKGFKNEVYLWPGGRIRGVELDLGEEVKRIVKTQTGCQIRLVGAYSEYQAVDSIDGGGGYVINAFNPAPFLIMRQNREQKNGVPGHVDLLYIGIVENVDRKHVNAFLMDFHSVARGGVHDRFQLWPYTVQAILQAHQALKSFV